MSIARILYIKQRTPWLMRSFRGFTVKQARYVMPCLQADLSLCSRFWDDYKLGAHDHMWNAAHFATADTHPINMDTDPRDTQTPSNQYRTPSAKVSLNNGYLEFELGPDTEWTIRIRHVPDDERQSVNRVFTPLQGTFMGYTAILEAALELIDDGHAKVIDDRHSGLGGLSWRIESSEPSISHPNLIQECRAAIQGQIRENLVSRHKLPKFFPAHEFR